MGTDRTGPSILQRRNSISSGAPTMLDLPSKPQSSSFAIGDKAIPTVDFELFSLRPPAYTSLKDVLQLSPAGIQSPVAGGGNKNCYEISIRNRLVKQAAWAYLQPMAASPNSARRSFFWRMWVRLSGDHFKNPVNTCLGFLKGLFGCI
ncbi:uncharacterized protein LOC143880568 [Tasmannia lanceolata]|uniref:uncharacterized protein LOC143880568 n=1 Tax=Tasmannia lanceolata TaxID=3420 RepID=UPI0040642B3F